MNVPLIRRGKRGGIGFTNTGGGSAGGGSVTDLSPYLDMWPVNNTPGATSDDPSVLYPPPGYNIKPSGTAPEMTPEEMKAAQDEARAELAKIGNEGATAAQITAALVTGVLRIATAGEKAAGCASGYVYQNGDCIGVAPGVTPGGQWFAGISNMAVMGIAGGTVLTVVLFASLGGGGRR